MYVYKITNTVNNKVYIGKCESGIDSYKGSGLLLKRAYEKYGEENFVKEILEDNIVDKSYLSDREKYWIGRYNSTNQKIGYNITEGGDGGDTLTNHPDIEEIKRKISDKGKRRILSNKHKRKLSE